MIKDYSKGIKNDDISIIFIDHNCYCQIVTPRCYTVNFSFLGQPEIRLLL